MRILAFAASLRAGSLNRQLIELAAQIARDAGADVNLVDFRTFEIPLYDGDLESSGLPAGAVELQRGIQRADGIMIATPEYNYSISGVLKNAIDWVSRARPMPWRGKSVYLLSASPSLVGGARGLWQTRIPLEACGALVFPDMFSLPVAHDAFDAEGQLRDPAHMERLQREVTGFARLAEAVAPICGKPITPQAKRRQKEIVVALERESELQPPRS
jgi:chromate reductase, NAD(P)H dehydrogenase (quinone)